MNPPPPPSMTRPASRRPPWPTVLLAATLMTAWTGHPEAAGIYLEALDTTNTAEFKLRLVDDGVNEPGYVLESAPDLGSGAWTPVPDPAVVPAGGGRFVITVPLHGASRGFYRVRSIDGRRHRHRLGRAVGSP